MATVSVSYTYGLRSRSEERKSAPQAKRFFGGRAVAVYLMITREPVNRPRIQQPRARRYFWG